MIRALLAAVVLTAASFPVAAAPVTLSAAPLITSSTARYVRVTILNTGPSVVFSNGNFFATPSSNSTTPLVKSFDNCTTGATLASGYICTLQITLPSPTSTVWFSITSTSSTGLRGAMQITDSTYNTLAVSDLR